jgi:N-acetylated-alpha-linked acidic dipeptidase
VYPEGGYANDTCIERGSINTLDYPGDPLTPGVEATRGARRLNLADVALPKIPVQPIGYGAAVEIMKRMSGPAVPSGWQGGLPLPYRLNGGDGLTVRLMVRQKREVKPSWNVVGTLRGTDRADLRIVIGCHHDAWDCGACDPLCGQIALLEAARSLGALAREGIRPRRTVVFAAWGAEEFGIMGSTEWVEGRTEELTRSAVAYMNLDMASMGVDFGSGASPSLRRGIVESARMVPQARTPGRSALETWIARAPDDVFADRPRFGDLGGGSDHVAFLCHAGVPSMSLSGGGAVGTAYHSIYDTLAWYRKVVGDDYEPALMVSRAAATVAARLAFAPLLPLDPSDYGPETRRLLIALSTRGRELGVFASTPARDIAPELARVEGAALEFNHHARRVMDRVRAAVGRADLAPERLEAINDRLILADRCWLIPDGIPDRPWFRNLYAAPDRDSGYAPWMLPYLRGEVEKKDRRGIERAEDQYLRSFEALTRLMDEIDALLEVAPKSEVHESP